MVRSADRVLPERDCDRNLGAFPLRAGPDHRKFEVSQDQQPRLLPLLASALVLGCGERERTSRDPGRDDHRRWRCEMPWDHSFSIYGAGEIG